MDPKDAVRHLRTLVYGSDNLRTQQKLAEDIGHEKRRQGNGKEGKI